MMDTLFTYYIILETRFSIFSGIAIYCKHSQTPHAAPVSQLVYRTDPRQTSAAVM